jgi:hypothetical protein
MKLSDFCAETAFAPGESDWLDFVDVAILSGEMVVADPTLYPDGVVLKVPAGIYQVQVRISNDSSVPVVSELRAFCRNPREIGGSAGDVSVDFARLGIGDNVEIRRVSQAITPEMAEPIWESLETRQRWGIVPWDVQANVSMPFVTPGDGDGRYEVKELIDGDGVVGIQVGFLEAE